MDVVVPPSYIKLGKEGAASKVVNGLGNKRGDVAILLGSVVDRAVVLDRTKFTIFLLNKEEIGSVGTPRFPDGASSEMFGNELVNLLYFKLGERE